VLFSGWWNDEVKETACHFTQKSRGLVRSPKELNIDER
jgi:hypothetical protein